MANSVFEGLSNSRIIPALGNLSEFERVELLSLIFIRYKTSSLALRTTLNLAFCYHKLGSYNSSVRTLLFLLNELNHEIFEAICDGI